MHAVTILTEAYYYSCIKILWAKGVAVACATTGKERHTFGRILPSRILLTIVLTVAHAVTRCVRDSQPAAGDTGLLEGGPQRLTLRLVEILRHRRLQALLLVGPIGVVVVVAVDQGAVDLTCEQPGEPCGVGQQRVFLAFREREAFKIPSGKLLIW